MHDCIVVRRMEDHKPADSEYFEETMMDEDTDSDELNEEMKEVVFWYCLVLLIPPTRAWTYQLLTIESTNLLRVPVINVEIEPSLHA